MIEFIKRKRKGTSLTEVMIVLGIISTTIVASVTVLVNSMAQIKANELEDAASSFMIQAVELSKSPAPLNIPDSGVLAALNQSFGNTFYFSLEETRDGSGNKVLTQQSIALQSTCDENSPYNIVDFLDEDLRAFSMCLQIGITPRLLDFVPTNGSRRFFELESKVVYQVPKETRITSITGYRFDDFTNQ